MTMISLLLQNSSGEMSVGVASGKKLLFDSNLDIELAGSRNVGLHVKSALENSNGSQKLYFSACGHRKVVAFGYFTLFLLVFLRKKVIFEVHTDLDFEGKINNFIFLIKI